MPTRQKVIAILVVIILIFVIWQIIGLLREGGAPEEIIPTKPSSSAMDTAGPNQPPKITPKPVEVPTLQPTTERMAAIQRLQKDMQDKYLEAVNELQMLKVQRDIAVVNKDISTAQLDRVEAQKKIVDALSPTAPPAPAALLNGKTVGGGTTIPSPQAEPTVEASYTVISVSMLQSEWSAVMGYKGTLYNVHIGDILPPDSSRVIAIGKTGVTLIKEGVRKKISLVPAV